MLPTSETSENISEFPSVRSKKARTISIKLYFEIISSERYRLRVEEHRRLKALPGHEAEAQAVKDGMPCIVPAGVCNDGHAVKNLVELSGLLCIDLDHTNNRTQEIFLLLQQLPWVVGAHFSISYEGVKAFVRVSTEDVRQNYAALYAAVGNAVAAHVKHPYDDKCKILTQPCFYSWHPDAYFNEAATVFTVDELTREQVDEGISKEGNGKVDKGKDGKEVTPSSTRNLVNSSTESSSTESAPGFLTQFLDDFERRNPFIRGSRNSLALKLGRTARSKGFSKSELEELVQIFARHYANADFTKEDIRKRLLAGYQFIEEQKANEKQETRGQKGVTVTLPLQGTQNEEESIEDVLENNNALRASAPYIADNVFSLLPDFLKRCCLHATDKRERDLLLLGCLNSCSALLPYVSFFYKNRLYSPHFYLAVVAPAGNGKGVMAFTSVLLNPTQELYDQQRREKKKVYEQALLDWEQEQLQARHEKRKPNIDLKPEETRPQYLKISATTSKSQLIQCLAVAGETGCYMATTEINTMVSALGQDYGKYEDILCKAAHHEEVSSFYKIDGEPIVAPDPHLTLSLAGTQEQFRSFFRSLEVGLYSRFGIYTRQQNLQWESCAPAEGQTDLHKYFLELGKELKEMHQVLLQSPTLVTFSDEQWQYHTDLFTRLLGRALTEGGEAAGGIIFRSGLLVMRLASIFTVFRKWDDYRYAKEYRCTDQDFQAAASIVETLIEHSLLMSTSLPATSQPPVGMHCFHRMEDVLDKMSRFFSYTEFIHAVEETGASESSGKRFLRKATDMQIIVKEKDGYRKKNQKRLQKGAK